MKRLKRIKRKVSGRSSGGQVVVRHKGGAHKRYYRVIDTKRDKANVAGTVTGIEYDPNRSADIALVQYTDGERRYILAAQGVKVADVVVAGTETDIKPGNSMRLGNIPVGTVVHNVEITPGRGGQLARSAGTGAVISAREGSYVHVRLPSGEVRKVSADGIATIGQLGKVEWKDRVIGKAGRKRHMGIRPTVRGVAQNPRSHAHGGGEGRSGIGMATPKNYAGRKAVGKTRNPNKYSNKYILQRRKK